MNVCLAGYTMFRVRLGEKGFEISKLMFGDDLVHVFLAGARN